MQPQQPGYSSSHVYLELLADLPWQNASEEHELDLRAAKGVLTMIIMLKPDARGPVLCFVGPPGIGKTSLASSITAALD
ncbi:hypothetical protein IFM89_018648 [Coptis chinensis]|uniref:Uncharacterized protein n=1 Tax=Coptis chinensis TaxID=261450 RepID=A0A835HWU3_9MAGN|nr:hypothetical protein IFM89_018648 [Coptis chinensis]